MLRCTISKFSNYAKLRNLMRLIVPYNIHQHIFIRIKNKYVFNMDRWRYILKLSSDILSICTKSLSTNSILLSSTKISSQRLNIVHSLRALEEIIHSTSQSFQTARLAFAYLLHIYARLFNCMHYCPGRIGDLRGQQKDHRSHSHE